MTENTENTIQETVKKGFGWDLIPRKIIGGMAAMFLVWKAAIDLSSLPVVQFYFAIGGMVWLGTMAIYTHYLLERGPKTRPQEPEK